MKKKKLSKVAIIFSMVLMVNLSISALSNEDPPLIDIPTPRAVMRYR